MDPNGNSANDQIFDNNIGDNVTFQFPAGTLSNPNRYAFNDWENNYNVDNFTMEGLGSGDKSHRKAIIQPLNTGSGYNRFGNFRGTNHTLKNLTFNAYDEEQTDITIWYQTDDNLLIEEVEFWGRIPDSDKTGSQVNADITSSGGSGTIRKLAICTKYGAVQTEYSNARGLTITGDHVGDLTIDRCRVEDLGGSGIRSTHSDGPITLKNSYFENVFNASVRINNESNKLVTNCEVRATDTSIDAISVDLIRVDGTGDSCTPGGTVEDCDLYMAANVNDTGCIVNRGFSDTTDMTVRNCRIESNDSMGPFRVLSDGCGGTWTVESCSVTGSSPTPVNEKSGTLRDCCFPSGADLSDWNTDNITRGNCESPTFTLMSGSGFWPSTDESPKTVTPTRNGNVVTKSGNVVRLPPLPTYSN
jgi:hypothetical protein